MLTLLICNYEFSLLLIYCFKEKELVCIFVEKCMKGGGRNRELCSLQAISRPKGLSWLVFGIGFFFLVFFGRQSSQTGIQFCSEGVVHIRDVFKLV